MNIYKYQAMPKLKFKKLKSSKPQWDAHVLLKNCEMLMNVPLKSHP